MKRSQSVVLCTVGMLALAAGFIVAGRAAVRTSPPLDLADDGIYGPSTIKNTQGETLLYNFRTVEPGVLYRASAVPQPGGTQKPDTSMTPIAFQDDQLFTFLREMKIRHVVSLAPTAEFYVEDGYLQYWAGQTGYAIEATSVPVLPGHVYSRDDRSGLRAAAELLQIMKDRQAGDGAVFVHGDAGKDGTGVAVAAYELWRNSGTPDAEALWRRVRRRYLASNALLPQEPGVTGEQLDGLRGDLEFLVKL